MQHFSARPVPPSEVLGREVSPRLEQIVLECLSKQQADLPASARELAALLAGCATQCPWTDEQARSWWRKYANAPCDEGLSSCVSPTAGNDMQATLIGQEELDESR